MSDNNNRVPEHSGVFAGIVHWFAHNSIAANLLMILVIVLGFVSYGGINKESFPDIEPSTVGVSVAFDSGSAQQTQEAVTIKLENAIEQVRGISSVNSFSFSYGSRLTIRKTSDTDLDDLVEDVRTAIEQTPGLPQDAKTPRIAAAQLKKDTLWVEIFGDADKNTLSKVAKQVKDDLIKQPAIRDVSFMGNPEKIVSVEVSQSKLDAYGLSLSDVSRVINAESSGVRATSIRDGNKVLRLAVAKQSYYAKDFAQLVVRTFADGSRITLADVAAVTDTVTDESEVISRFNGKQSIGIQIFSDKNTDIEQVVDQANQVVTDWQLRVPDTVQLTSWIDQSKYIKQRLQLLFDNAFFGFILVFIILALFLNMRIAFWVAAGLPFIFFGTFYLMGEDYAGLTINYITTFGFIMALGIVVDDAVVVGESIYSHRQKYGDTVASTVAGTMAVAKPTILGVLTTVVTFLSLASIEGAFGQIYAQFGLIVTFCLLLSIVESKFILPSHLAHLSTKKVTQTRNPVKKLWSLIQAVADAGMQKANDGFAKLIRVVLRFRYASFISLVALFIFAIGLTMTDKVKAVFFPDIPGDIMMVTSEVTSETGYQQNYDNLLYIEKTLYEADKNLITVFKNSQAKTDEEQFLAQEPVSTGIKNVRVMSTGDSTGQIIVELTQNMPYNLNELVAEWKQLTGEPAGTKSLKYMVSFQRGDNFKIDIKASDMATITAVGLQVKDILKTFEGVTSIQDNITPNKPQIRFELTNNGRSLGFTTAELGRQVMQTFGGGTTQTFMRENDEVSVRVRYPKEQRNNISSLYTAMVVAPNGDSVPLNQVATIKQELTTDSILRIDGQNAGYVTASIDKDILAPEELVQTIKDEYLPEIKKQFPQVNVSFGGESEQQNETVASMQKTFGFALLIIFMILAIALNSYFQPIIIMAVIPYGIVGAIMGHWFMGMNISIFSMNGILALTGVVVNDSLLLMSKYNENVKLNMNPTQAITEAASSRFRAVILTSMTTFVGLVPLLFETSLQAQFLKPAAVSLAYGILFATVITLVLIPLLVHISTDLAAIRTKIKNMFLSIF